jgi:hypothetical protein
MLCSTGVMGPALGQLHICAIPDEGRSTNLGTKSNHRWLVSFPIFLRLTLERGGRRRVAKSGMQAASTCA